jgi:hypothetical protein
LGILIAAPHPGKTAMYHDMTAEARALVRRGYSSDHILCLHGRVDPELVVACSRTVKSNSGCQHKKTASNASSIVFRTQGVYSTWHNTIDR